MKTNKKLQLFLLLSSVFIPNLFNIHIIGLNLTFGRAVVILISLLCFCRDRGKIIFCHQMETVCVMVFSCWIAYGIFFMLLKETMHRAAIKEVINVLFGVLIIYSITHLIRNSKEMLEYTVEVIRLLIMLCILIGLIEIITGRHLETSCFNDINYIDTLTEIYGNVNFHQATGFQYGTNDFSAFLTFFFPVFLVNGRRKIYDYFLIGTIVLICSVNSSTLCILTIGLGIALYSIKERRLKIKNAIGIGISMIVLYISLVLLDFQYGNMFSLTTELKNHLYNYQMGGGSSYKRFWTYIESIKISADTFLAGIGPANFTNYVTSNPAKKILMNPHNFWLEILTEYGILILALYLLLLLVIYGKIRHIYTRKRVRIGLLIQIMLIDYIVVGIVPSTFISYWYQWVLIALGITAVNIYEMKRGGCYTAYEQVEKYKG